MSLALLPRHPLHMWKYHITLYHFPSRAPLTRTLDSDSQLRKQPALAFFFPVLRSWTCGLAWSAAQTATTGMAFIGSRTKCLFSLYCWEWEMGGTLVYLWVGPLGCVQRKNCPLHTIDWQARQEPRHHSSRTLDSSRSFSFLKHRTLKL